MGIFFLTIGVKICCHGGTIVGKKENNRRLGLSISRLNGEVTMLRDCLGLNWKSSGFGRHTEGVNKTWLIDGNHNQHAKKKKRNQTFMSEMRVLPVPAAKTSNR